jgi:hypothetical protein
MAPAKKRVRFVEPHPVTSVKIIEHPHLPSQSYSAAQEKKMKRASKEFVLTLVNRYSNLLYRLYTQDEVHAILMKLKRAIQDKVRREVQKHAHLKKTQALKLFAQLLIQQDQTRLEQNRPSKYVSTTHLLTP